jgi:hypothetical protein
MDRDNFVAQKVSHLDPSGGIRTEVAMNTFGQVAGECKSNRHGGNMT